MPEAGNAGSPLTSLPDFALTADDGRTVTKADVAGHRAVIWFYPKADTPGCTTEAQDFTRLAEDFAALGVRLFGVSPDPQVKVSRFKQKREIGPTLLSDESTAFAQAMNVWVEKSMYGRTYMGVERSTFLVDENGSVVREWRKVRVKGHSEAVLQAAKDQFG